MEIIMQANVSFQEADFTEVEYGDLNRDQTVEAFNAIDWNEKVAAFERELIKTDDCCPPHFLITFGRSYYLSITVEPGQILVMLSRPTKGYTTSIKKMEEECTKATLEEIPGIIRKAFDDFMSLHQSM